LAGHGHHGRSAGAGRCRAHNLTDALDLANGRPVRNLADLVLFLDHFVYVRRRRIGHLHRAAANKRAAASACTKFR
jgi:hypothetical protein